MKHDRSGMNRPVCRTVAGRLERRLGIRLCDMYLARRELSPATEPSTRSCSCEVRLATERELETIVSLLGSETGDDFGHYRSVRSACYIADHEGRTAGYLWVNHHSVEMKRTYLAKLPGGYAFTHGAVVFPVFRGRRIYRNLRDAVCAELHKSGFMAVACLVDKTNRSSITGTPAGRRGVLQRGDSQVARDQADAVLQGAGMSHG